MAAQALIERPADEGLQEARRRLSGPPARGGSMLSLLAASAALALSAMVLAGAVILGPFWQVRTEPAAVEAVFR